MYSTTIILSSYNVLARRRGQLGRKCQELCTNLEQYEQVATPESIDQYQTAVIESVTGSSTDNLTNVF